MVTNVSEVKSALTPVFDQYHISQAILFGSVAKGTATKKSDLDLLVKSNLRGLKFVALWKRSVKRPGCLWMCSMYPISSRVR